MHFSKLPLFFPHYRRQEVHSLTMHIQDIDLPLTKLVVCHLWVIVTARVNFLVSCQQQVIVISHPLIVLSKPYAGHPLLHKHTKERMFNMWIAQDKERMWDNNHLLLAGNKKINSCCSQSLRGDTQLILSVADLYLGYAWWGNSLPASCNGGGGED